MRRPARPLLVALAAALLATAAACSDDGDDAEDQSTIAPAAETTTAAATPAAEGSDDGFPVTVAAANGDVTVDARPIRIVSLSPSLTEMLFAVGAGDQVIAVDDQSNYPPEAPVTDLSGFEPNVEAIAAQGADLVVVSDDINNVVSGLTALDIPVAQFPAAVSMNDTYAQIEQIGALTGNVGGAAEVVAGMQQDIDEIVASAPTPPDALSYYHELDNTLFSVTSSTFIGEVYKAFGLENIADAVDDGSGYPQLSAEYLLEQNPDLVFLADTKCCGETAETVAARPGWGELVAVQNGTVVELDDDVASRWGPRVVDFYRVIADAIASVPVS